MNLMMSRIPLGITLPRLLLWAACGPTPAGLIWNYTKDELRTVSSTAVIGSRSRYTS